MLKYFRRSLLEALNKMHLHTYTYAELDINLVALESTFLCMEAEMQINVFRRAIADADNILNWISNLSTFLTYSPKQRMS